MKQRCKIKFEFDKPDRKYQAGDSIKGQLIVSALQDISVKAIHMQLSWQGTVNDKTCISEETIWLSSQDKENIIKLEFDETEMLSGESHRIPFAFEAPVGPLSYKGENLVIDWVLRANIDLPNQLAMTEPRAHSKLWISSKEGQAIHLGSHYKKPEQVKPFLEGGDLMYAIFTALGTGGILWYLSSGSDPFQTRGDTILFWVILIIGCLLVLAQIADYFSDQGLAKTLKKLEFQLDSQQVMPGGALNYRFFLESKEELQLKGLKLQLNGLEHTFGDRQDSMGYRERIHEQKLVLAENVTLPAKSEFEKAGKIMIPNSLPCTFHAEKKGAIDAAVRIVYELKFELEFEGGMSERRTYQIDVVPWLDEIAGGELKSLSS